MKNPLFSETFFEDRRIIRGGSWYDNAGHERVSGRDRLGADYRYSSPGFRLFRSKP